MDQAERLRNMVKASKKKKEAKAARLITVTSGKGGVGKSNTSVNLAVQFRSMGYRVIIFDADFGLANVEVMFGVIPKYNLSDLIFRGRTLEEIIIEGPMGILFISGGSGVEELVNLTNENVRFLAGKLVQLDQIADIIIVDTGAGIADSVLEFVKISREVILVTTPEPTSIMDSYALLKTLRHREGFDSNYTEIHVLGNRIMEKGEGEVLYEKLKVVVDKFLDMRLSYLGSIPYDISVSKAIMQQKPISMVNKISKVSLAYEEIAKKLLDMDIRQEEEQKRPSIGQVFLNLFHNSMKKISQKTLKDMD